MWHGRRFSAVIVTGDAENAAMFRGAGGVGVFQHIARPVDAGALRVPDTEDAVVFGAGRELQLLRAQIAVAPISSLMAGRTTTPAASR